MKTFQCKDMEQAIDAVEELAEHEINSSITGKSTVKFSNADAERAISILTELTKKE